MFRGFFGGDAPDERFDPETLELARDRMVRTQLEARDIRDPLVLRAMRAVPRHIFVPPEELSLAYEDHALPIAYGQTISQPYIVAFMAQMLEPEEGLKVLEVGAGSGYQAAVLAACGLDVYAIERISGLVATARRNLEAAGLADRVSLRLGDGSHGWPEEAPFDRVLVSAATDRVPRALVEQLCPRGLLLAPVGGSGHQQIRRYVKRPDGELEEESLIGARFVPLVRGVPPVGDALGPVEPTDADALRAEGPPPTSSSPPPDPGSGSSP